MLKRKIAMAVFTAAMSSGAFAEMNDSADNASMYQELQALKAEVAMLQSQIQTNQQHKKGQDSQNNTDVALEDSADLQQQSDITVPTNKGEIQNFLFSDIHDEAIPIGRLSSTQFALGLLQQRNYYSDKALIFGGYLEINPQIWHGSTIASNKGGDTTKPHTYQSGKGIYITTATLYTAANLGRYVTAQLSLSGNQDNSPKVDDALVIFGNLSDFPLYGTVGKNRIPFGSFSGGGRWTVSLTQMLFCSSRVTNASLAYYQDGLNTNITFFQTNDHTSNGAYGVSYGGEMGQFSYGINGGYVYNVNGTGNSSFDAITKSGDTAIARVGAFNVDLRLTYDLFGMGFGWAQTTNKSDVTNNARAGAWYVQAGVSPEIYGRSTNFNLAYNGAYNTSRIPITLSGSAINSYTTDKTPGSGVNKMIIASVQRPFFTDNVLFGLEYAYMHMYNSKHSNAYTLDISIYF